MNWELFIFVWIALMAAFASQVNITRTELVEGTERRRWRPFWALLAFWPIFYISVFDKPRSDTWLYLSTFDNLPATWNSFASTIEAHDSGFAFRALGILVKNFFGNDRTAYRIIIGLIHSLPVVLIFRKYSDNYIFSLYLFAATSCHFAWMMNGIRQFVAVVIIFAATPLIIRKKYIPLIIIVLLAATFHTSALFMLPVVFIVQGKAWNWRTILFIFAAVVAAYVFSRNSSAFDMLLEGTEYENTLETYQKTGDDGIHPLRVLVSMVPVLMSFISRKEIELENDPVLNVLVNMSVITLGINLVAMVTSGIMTGRMAIYTSLYNLILLPHVIHSMFRKDSARVVSAAAVGMYAIYYYLGA